MQRYRRVSGIFVLFWFGCMLALPNPSDAAETTATQMSADNLAHESGVDLPATGLATLDWIIIGIYGIATIGLGYYYSRKQRSTSEYFVGSGSMNPIVVGVSLFATLLSTISYLSMPGESLGKGPVILTTLLALPVVYWVVGYGLIPVYMKHRVTSAYELLEVKLGLGIRLLGATMFILLRIVWMSLLVYLTAKAIIIMIGIDQYDEDVQAKWIQWIVLITGFVAVLYTSLGGLQAVVITDLMQTLLLFGGALLVLGTVTYDYGGFGWFPTTWHAGWDTQPIYSFDPATRVTVVGSFLTYLVWYVCTAGGDQTTVQRFMATKDAAAARKAYATQLCVSVVVSLTLATVGFALLGYFEAHPKMLPSHMTINDNADDIFPRYIAFHLPVGISGLVVAAMFAAAMSSLDSGVNSITAVIMTDFLDRFGITPKTETGHVRAAQMLAFGIGAVVVLGSAFVDKVPGNITAVTQKTSNLLTTPIFGLFFFALFVPFAKPAGVLVGAFCGTVTAVFVAFSGPIFHVMGTLFNDLPYDRPIGPDPISFQWIAPASFLVNVVTGAVVSYVLHEMTRDQSK